MRPPSLDPLEIYSGMVFGARRSALPELAPMDGTPADVLEALLAEALAHPPCHVLFSGGRDSAIILAAAARAARRRGLPEPIPMTALHLDQPESREDEWQALVLEHLQLQQWRRLEVTDEFDLLGPVVQDALRRHGPFWPPFALSMLLFGALAGEGTIVTGGGGDEIFQPWAWQRVPVSELLRRRPVSSAAKWLAFYRLPLRVRQRVLADRYPEGLPWMRPEAAAEVRELMSHDDRPVPTLQADLERYVASRYRECVRGTIDTFAAETGVRAVEPFYDERFVRAYADSSPRTGYVSRSAALEAHFADLLPEAVLRRRTKAYFTRAGWGPTARAFAERWDGSGVDASIVDPEHLRVEWAKPAPDARTVGALHQAFLSGAAA